MSCNCQEVAEKGKKDIENSLKIPFAAHESAMARSERHTKSLIWVIVLLIVLLVGTNAGWLIYESQFEVVEETTETIITQDMENEKERQIFNAMLDKLNKRRYNNNVKHIIFY